MSFLHSLIAMCPYLIYCRFPTLQCKCGLFQWLKKATQGGKTKNKKKHLVIDSSNVRNGLERNKAERKEERGNVEEERRERNGGAGPVGKCGGVGRRGRDARRARHRCSTNSGSYPLPFPG